MLTITINKIMPIDNQDNYVEPIPNILRKGLEIMSFLDRCIEENRRYRGDIENIEDIEDIEYLEDLENNVIEALKLIKKNRKFEKESIPKLIGYPRRNLLDMYTTRKRHHIEDLDLEDDVDETADLIATNRKFEREYIPKLTNYLGEFLDMYTTGERYNLQDLAKIAYVTSILIEREPTLEEELTSKLKNCLMSRSKEQFLDFSEHLYLLEGNNCRGYDIMSEQFKKDIANHYMQSFTIDENIDYFISLGSRDDDFSVRALMNLFSADKVFPNEIPEYGKEFINNVLDIILNENPNNPPLEMIKYTLESTNFFDEVNNKENILGLKIKDFLIKEDNFPIFYVYLDSNKESDTIDYLEGDILSNTIHLICSNYSQDQTLDTEKTGVFLEKIKEKTYIFDKSFLEYMLVFEKNYGEKFKRQLKEEFVDVIKEILDKKETEVCMDILLNDAELNTILEENKDSKTFNKYLNNCKDTYLKIQTEINSREEKIEKNSISGLKLELEKNLINRLTAKSDMFKENLKSMEEILYKSNDKRHSTMQGFIENLDNEEYKLEERIGLFDCLVEGDSKRTNPSQEIYSQSGKKPKQGYRMV